MVSVIITLMIWDIICFFVTDVLVIVEVKSNIISFNVQEYAKFLRNEMEQKFG